MSRAARGCLAQPLRLDGLPAPRLPAADVILDAALLPTDADVFRYSQGWATVIVSGGFADAVACLGLDGVKFQELETR